MQVTPDGFEQIDVINVTSVDLDKRIEYIKNWIERINAGDKYTWNFVRSKFEKESYYDRLEIVKENYSNRMDSGLDYELYSQPNSNSDSDSFFDSDSYSDSRTYSDFSKKEEGMVLCCNHFMFEYFKVYLDIRNTLITVKWYNAI